MFATMAKQAGLSYSSLLELFRQQLNAPLYYQIDAHWTAFGQGVAAQAVSALVKNQLPR